MHRVALKSVIFNLGVHRIISAVKFDKIDWSNEDSQFFTPFHEEIPKFETFFLVKPLSDLTSLAFENERFVIRLLPFGS